MLDVLDRGLNGLLGGVCFAGDTGCQGVVAVARGLSDQFDDADEAFRLPGGASDEQTVNVVDGQDRLAILRRDRTAVDDARLCRNLFTAMFAQNFTQGGMPSGNVFGRSGFGAADGPTRLVSEDDVGDAMVGLAGQ